VSEGHHGALARCVEYGSSRLVCRHGLYGAPVEFIEASRDFHAPGRLRVVMTFALEAFEQLAGQRRTRGRRWLKGIAED
jgi:hypothetical protein